MLEIAEGKHSMQMTASRWLVAACIIVCFAGCSATAQEGNGANEVSRGHELAAIVCSNCHVAAADQRFPPILNPPAPSFTSIAQRKDVTAESLAKFITTTHRGLDNPSGMPNPSLADYQVKQVVAYLLSLRKEH
jgi:mono/diheme cytochrome c family protein